MKASTIRLLACCVAVLAASCRPAAGPSAPTAGPVPPLVPAPRPAPSPDTLTAIPGNAYVTLGAPASTVDDTDRVTIARPAPGNGQDYKWFLFPGTVVKLTGSQKASGDDFVRIELDSGQVAWVLRSELQAQHISTTAPTGFAGDSLAPVRQIGGVRVLPSLDWIDVEIPMTGPPPAYLVEETDRTISLLVYGVTSA